MDTDPEQVTLTLRPSPGCWASPPMKRLALLLKAMLRAYGWRCVDIRTEQAGREPAGGEPTKPKEDTAQ
jgi:hypothetical protein